MVKLEAWEVCETLREVKVDERALDVVCVVVVPLSV